MNIVELAEFLTSPQALISAFGLIGVITIVFLETGFVFGFFFPGDSLLFTAGLLSSQGYMPIWGLLIGVFLAAVVGDNVGYAFGRRVGPALFTKEDSAIFSKANLAKAQHFYEKYGVRTIILARFVPVIRTFAPIVAGIGNMKYSTFVKYNVIGGFVWVFSLIGLGYGFGKIIPDPDRYILPVIAIIILVSAAPVIREIYHRFMRKG